ncbi:MAG: hypothetical protein AB197_00475 [Parcubacteria bacterium C7867-002]|nr:MAG: hypothetical protein AB197_00475 [Parcubacteria bacterium C7867-002]
MDGKLITFDSMRSREHTWFPDGKIEIMIAGSIFRATCDHIEWNRNKTPSKIVFNDTWTWLSRQEFWVRRGASGSVLFPVTYREQFEGPFEISQGNQVFFMIQHYRGPFEIHPGLLEIDSIETSPQYTTLFPRGNLLPHRPQNPINATLYAQYLSRYNY